MLKLPKELQELDVWSHRNDSCLWRQPRHNITGEINHSAFRNRLSLPLRRKINVEKCSHPVAPFLNRCAAIERCVPSGIRPTLTFCDPCDDNGVFRIALRRWRSVLQVYCKQVPEENALVWNYGMGGWIKFCSKELHDFCPSPTVFVSFVFGATAPPLPPSGPGPPHSWGC